MLASDIVVIPYRNPVVQAKLLGTIDVLSGGRLMLGTGTGHVRAESEALGVDFDVRGRMHDEYLRVIKAVLSSEEASFEGEFVRFGPLRTLIRPVQQPHPPIYVGGNAPRSIRRAAELGDGWLPSDAPPDGLARGIDALRAACERIGRTELPAIAVSLPSTLRFAVPGVSTKSASSTPDEAIALLQAYERLGVDHVSLGFRMPTADVYLGQIETFAAEVLPAFSAGEPDAGAR
jgi:probable F420-dependent oxidoreductase